MFGSWVGEERSTERSSSGIYYVLVIFILDVEGVNRGYRYLRANLICAGVVYIR